MSWPSAGAEDPHEPALQLLLAQLTAGYEVVPNLSALIKLPRKVYSGSWLLSGIGMGR